MSDGQGAPLSGLEVAIVGMAGRFPGAPGVEAFWANLCAGVESISRFSREELLASGILAADLDHPAYVPARAMIEGAELFDARFFDFNPREAEITDPQHRLFLECAWEALEGAGYDAPAYSGRIGVFAGTSMSSYLLSNLLSNSDVVAAAGSFQMMIANDKDFLPTRVSYKLNLKGPSVLVQTACSSSLVAVHFACQSLLNGECEMALAGAASVSFPQRRGYLFQQGAIFSPDGRCRPFDAQAQGTVNGDGVAVVVLKRLEDALSDGDRIHAVVRGSAINNDGAGKVGFTAPGVEGQAAVIGAAQAMAGVEAADIGYVEAHGTATSLGDPIEITALTEAFRVTTDRTGYCAIGSLKGNIGHLDTAAGVAGLIKAALALERGAIPPSLHFERPNPEIDFATSPFFVARELTPWPANGAPRRAAVSSFGIGGTNAHAVLEEAPPLPPASLSRPWQVLVVSARSEAALERATDDLATALQAGPDRDLADAAYTLKVGRHAFEHRRALVCRDVDGPAGAAAALRSRDGKRLLAGLAAGGERPVCFLFPGQGAQYVGMAAELYRGEPTFRRQLDLCAEELRPWLGPDALAPLYPPDGEAASAGVDVGGAAWRLQQTAVAQPLLFSVEYALARLWMEWGVEPAAMIGHSVGEYVAACLAGVLSLPDALRLVAARGALMQALPPGAMLSVPLPPERLEPLLADGLALAAINARSLCTVAGPEPAVEALAAVLAAEGTECRRLHTSHAFHSPMMEPAMAPFREELRRVALQAPERRYVGNVGGSWITAAEATDPEYWLRHLREPVRFADGIAELLREPEAVLLEVGPGRTLGSLCKRHPDCVAGRHVLASLPHAQDAEPADAFLLGAVARLWLAGARLDWQGFYAHERRHRAALPTYPFERRSYWIAPRRPAEAAAPALTAGEAQEAQTEPVVMLPSGHARPGLATVYTAPRSDLERGLAGIWSILLGVEPVGAHDDFFDLGGHSLLATQVLSRVREAFDAEVALRQFMEAPTVADLAAAIEAERESDGDGAASHLPPLLPGLREEGGAPLSFSQERLWFLDQLEPGSPAYNIPFAVRLSGPLAVAALARSFGEIERRHEALRTVFDGSGDLPVQRVLPPSPCVLPQADLADLSREAQDAEVARLVVDNALAPFHLTAGPLFRTRLLRLAPGEWVLLVALHHSISDAWSFGVITGELSALYPAILAGEPSPLPELPVQYGDFARWQRRWLQGDLLERQLGYWRRQLDNPPRALRLPTLALQEEPASVHGALHLLAFDRELSAALAELGLERKATLFMTLLAAFDALLYFYSRQDDLLVGSPIAGRRHREAEPLVGFFVNTLVLRADLAGDPTFEELLARVRRTTLDAYANQDLPFERLVSALRLDRELHRNPLFRVWFVLQNAPAEPLRLPGVTAAPVVPERVAVRHDLKLDLTQTPEGLRGFFEVREGLFDEPTVERMAELFERVLREVVARPAVRLQELAETLAEYLRRQEAARRREMKSAAFERLQKKRRKTDTEDTGAAQHEELQAGRAGG